MMKNEFESRIGTEVSDEDYEIIEYVYTWHPHIDPVKGKDQMAALYQMPCGMAFICKMARVAKRAEKVRRELDAKLVEMDRMKQEYNEMFARYKNLEF